jgi:hypothetical protein
MSKKPIKPSSPKSPIWLGDGNEKRLVGWFLTLFLTGVVVLILAALFL